MPDATRRHVIIPAGGIGSRMGLPYPKQLLPFGRSTVIEHTCGLFEPLPIVVPIPAEFEAEFQAKLRKRVKLIHGGQTRYESVRLAFEALDDLPNDDLVIIHDAARPFLDPSTLDEACAQASEAGALIYAAPATDTIKLNNGAGKIQETLDRNRIHMAQTPQIFRVDVLRGAYAAYDAEPSEAPTDEARLVEISGQEVVLFASSVHNRKLTHREDLDLLQRPKMRIGHGHDVHRFDESRPLYLGGILIPNAPGLLGHSDADVLLHALIDALLGAAGLGDIGHWFPDNDPSFSGIRSTVLLQRVWEDLNGRGFRLVNADITVKAQAPKLAPHIAAMRACIVEHLDCDAVNIKATTTEGLGFVGRREGIAADAVVLLEEGVS